MTDPYQRLRARGARALLGTGSTAYRLETGLFPLPLGFAVKGERVLIELSPQTVQRHKMRVGQFLAAHEDARLFGFRLDDEQLASQLRRLFGELARVATQSILDVASTQSYEESPHLWLDSLLTRYEHEGDPPKAAI